MPSSTGWYDYEVPPFVFYVPSDHQYEVQKARTAIALMTATVCQVAANVDVAIDGLWKQHYAVD